MGKRELAEDYSYVRVESLDLWLAEEARDLAGVLLHSSACLHSAFLSCWL